MPAPDSKIDALRTLRERDPGIAMLPDLVFEILEARQARLAEIGTQQYAAARQHELELETERQTAERLAEAETLALATLEEDTTRTTAIAEARAQARGAVEIDRFATSGEIGRATIEATEHTRRAIETATDVQLVGQLTDAGAIGALVDNAVLGAYTAGIHRLAVAAEIRLEALAQADYAAHRNDVGYVSPVARQLDGLRSRMNAWRAEHPTPAQRIRQLEADAAREATTLRRAFNTVREHWRLDGRTLLARGIQPSARPAPAPGELQIGRHFENR